MEARRYAAEAYAGANQAAEAAAHRRPHDAPPAVRLRRRLHDAIMGDLNTDLISRTGYNNRALQIMIGDLGLVSCAGARWPASSCVFKTHKGDEAHAASHIDCILISEHSATAVRRFGIDADRDLMVDFDHAVLFTDIDMCQVLGPKRTSPQPHVPARRKSKSRYSDKLGVAQFRDFADKRVWRSEWAAAAQLRDGLIDDGVRVSTIANDDDLRAFSVSNLRESLRVVRLEVHGKRRVGNMLKSSVTRARAQESKFRAAAKRDINAVMERLLRGAIESVIVGISDGVDVLTDPVAVAVECCEFFSARRTGSMQLKWFRKYGAMEGHTVWVAAGNRTRRGLIKKVDNDGHCTTQYDGDEHTTSGVRREAMCLEWQLERSAASPNRRWKRRRGPTGGTERPEMARHIESMAAPPDLPDDTALLFRHSAEGRACRMRAVLGSPMGDDRSQVPTCICGPPRIPRATPQPVGRCDRMRGRLHLNGRREWRTANHRHAHRPLASPAGQHKRAVACDEAFFSGRRCRVVVGGALRTFRNYLKCRNQPKTRGASPRLGKI